MITSHTLSYAIAALLAVPVYAKATGVDPSLAWVHGAVTRSLLWGAFLILVLGLLAIARRAGRSMVALPVDLASFAAGTLLAACTVGGTAFVHAPGEPLDASVLQLVVAPYLAVVIPLLCIATVGLGMRARISNDADQSEGEASSSRRDLIATIGVMAVAVGWYTLRQIGWLTRAGPAAQIGTIWLGFCLPAYLCVRIAIDGGSPRTSERGFGRYAGMAGAVGVAILIGMMVWL